MNQIRKHTFQAISLLTASNGMLDVTIIPAMNQPDWLIPSELILSIDDYEERIWNYLWQQQDVAVFHLLPREQAPNKMIVLEGNTAAHRLALQTAGEIRQLKVRISEVKDAPLPERYAGSDSSEVTELHLKEDGVEAQTDDGLQDTNVEHFKESVIQSYLYQTVIIDNTHYLVPDLEKIAHQLVDLDS